MEFEPSPVWRDLDRGAERVLVTDGATTGQGRSALAAVRAAAASGYEPVVGVSGDRRRSLAAASRCAAGVVSLPPANDPGYAAAVRAVARRDVLTVLPASDAALLALGVPVERLLDKYELAARARGVGLEAPETATCTDGLLPDGMRFPVIVKPRRKASQGDRPAALARDGRELASLVDGRSCVVQPVVRGPMTAVAGVVLGRSFRAVVHQRYLRTWPVEAGTACAAVTVAGDPALEERLLALLGDYEGIVQIQFVNGAVIDVNPRVYGSLPLAVGAGANLVGVWCDALRGEHRPTVRARAGVRYRWFEGDVRHLLANVRARRMTATAALDCLRPRRGTAHSVVDGADLRPVLARLRHVVARGGRSE